MSSILCNPLNLTIGHRSQVGCHFSLNAPVTLPITLSSALRPHHPTSRHRPGYRRYGACVSFVTIHDGVWIASDVAGPSRRDHGAGSVIAGGSVVARDCPPNPPAAPSCGSWTCVPLREAEMKEAGECEQSEGGHQANSRNGGCDAVASKRSAQAGKALLAPNAFRRLALRCRRCISVCAGQPPLLHFLDSRAAVTQSPPTLRYVLAGA
jgi:hypothetical protein